MKNKFDESVMFVPSERVLKSAIEHGVNDVIVIGKDHNGMLYIASEASSAKHAIKVMMEGIKTLLDNHTGDK